MLILIANNVWNNVLENYTTLMHINKIIHAFNNALFHYTHTLSHGNALVFASTHITKILQIIDAINVLINAHNVTTRNYV